MKTEKIIFNEEKNVSLTSYVHEPSPEMDNFGKRPAMLVLPGGAYRFCSDREAEPIALAYAAAGFNAYVLRYSLNENSLFPGPLKDAEDALNYIRENAEKDNTDPDSVAAIGFSAGGHLCAALGTMGSVRPNAIILCYACVVDTLLKGVLYGTVPSLETQVDDRTPPAFMFATSDDSVVDIENTLAFASALGKKKIPFELHIYPKGSHGLSLARACTANGNPGLIDEDIAAWVPMSVKWLSKEFDRKGL